MIKTEVSVYSELLVSTSETTWRHNPQVQNLNLKEISVIKMFNDGFCLLRYDAG
jgi:hypothetical protein